MTRPPAGFEGLATVAAAASRVSNIGEGLIVWSSRPRARVTRACYLAWAALALAGLVDIARTRRFRRGWIVADAALCTVTNLSPSSWPDDRSLPVLAYGQMAALTVTAAATADFAPIAVGPVLTAWASWTWGLGGQGRRNPESRIPLVAASLEPILTYGAIALVSRRLRALEAEMNALSDAARHDAGVAALEVERERQHRLLHDTALQTLEAVAGDWHTDEDSLRALAAADAEQIRRALDDTTSADDLESALAGLCDRYRHAGLDVTFEARGLAGWSGPGADGLAAATREALVNSLKHAGPGVTRVLAEASAIEVTVTVVDDGVGFDPATTPAGFGLEHSIRRRVAEVGGSAAIESATGQGTAVRLRVPRR